MELLDGDLLLRPLRDDDAPAVSAACQDEEISRFIPTIPVPYTEAHARRWIQNASRTGQDGERLPFAIAAAETGEFLGTIEVRLGESGSIGYWVAPWARNRGIASRALRMLTDWAMRERGVRRMSLLTHPENIASQRVAEKAGFRRVGTRTHEPPFRDGTTDAVVFERD